MMATTAQAMTGSASTASALAPTSLDDAIVKSAEAALETVGRARDAIHSVIFGQEEVVDLALVTILSCGHGLLVGVPGLAKTKLVETLGTVLGLDARRVQFTPDLMPSDILGSEILDEGADRRRSFRFLKGPIFAQLLMADEINRASRRTFKRCRSTMSRSAASAMTCRSRFTFSRRKIRSSRRAPIPSPKPSLTG